MSSRTLPSALAELSTRDRQLALMLADGLPWNGATFEAAGFPKRSAMVRAAEYKHREDPRYIKFRQAVREAIDARFLRLAPIALSTLELEMASSGKDRVKAAIELLNRTGWPGSRELTVHHQHSVQNLSVEELRTRLASLWRELSQEERRQLSGMGIALPAPEIIEGQFNEIAPGTEQPNTELASAAVSHAAPLQGLSLPAKAASTGVVASNPGARGPLSSSPEFTEQDNEEHSN